MCVPWSPFHTRDVNSHVSMEGVYGSRCYETKVCSTKGVTLAKMTIDNVHHV